MAATPTTLLVLLCTIGEATVTTVLPVLISV